MGWIYADDKVPRVEEVGFCSVNGRVAGDFEYITEGALRPDSERKWNQHIPTPVRASRFRNLTGGKQWRGNKQQEDEMVEKELQNHIGPDDVMRSATKSSRENRV